MIKISYWILVVVLVAFLIGTWVDMLLAGPKLP
jgi:hypothetical protein